MTRMPPGPVTPRAGLSSTVPAGVRGPARSAATLLLLFVILAGQAAAVQAGAALQGLAAPDSGPEVIRQGAWIVVTALSLLVLGAGISRIQRERRRAEARCQVLERQLKEASRDGATIRQRTTRLELEHRIGGVATFEWDLASGRIDWSPAMEQICGLAPGGFDGSFEQWRRLLHPDDSSRVVRGLGDAIAGRSDLNIQLRIVRPDGGLRWLSCRTRMIRDDGGRPAQLLGVHCDLTEELQGVRKLRQSEEFLRLSADAFGGLLFDLDLVSGRLSNSRGLSNLLGWSEEEGSVDRVQWLQRIHPDDSAPARERLREAMERGADRVELSGRLRHRDGTWRPLLVRMMLLRDRRAVVVRLVGCAEDVTVLRETDTMLQREAARRRAEANVHAEPEIADLRTVITDAAAQASPVMRERRLKLTVTLPDEEVDLAGEIGRLPQIFGSLLRHLAAAAQPGGELDLSLKVIGKWAVVSLQSDTAPLSPAQRSSGFDGPPAVREADAAAAPHAHLRMAQVRTLVELQGGTLRVSGEDLGHGSHVTVTLPLTPEVARVAPTRVDTRF